MSHELPLTSFEVEGFRAIRHLRLPELGDVNLFVGKNSSGKTSLLEALRIYLSRSPMAELLDVIRAHGGPQPGLRSFADGPAVSPGELRWALEACRGIVWGSFDDQAAPEIRLGPLGDVENTLRVTAPWLARSREGLDGGLFFTAEAPVLKISRAGETADLTLAHLLRSLAAPVHREEGEIVYVPSAGLAAHDLFFLWKAVAAAGEAHRAEAGLRRVVPDLERIFVLDQDVFFQIAQTVRPVPLESLGEGTQRIFGFALAMIRARGGVLAVDEVESGLHHSIQQDVWDFLLAMAEEMRVQVFATTHSWESVTAFQSSANRSRVKGMLYRLERKGDGSSRVERYTEEEVAIAAEQRIEVR